jgi:Flp pilus assembly protein TadB
LTYKQTKRGIEKMVLKSLAVAILMGFVAFFVCVFLGLANVVAGGLAFIFAFFAWWFYELYKGSKERGCS